jgi:prepilin signal peptidase PulO-like enzyme (type II secretory pathway)
MTSSGMAAALPLLAVLVGLLASAAARHIGDRLSGILDEGIGRLWAPEVDRPEGLLLPCGHAPLIDAGVSVLLVVLTIVAGPERALGVLVLGGFVLAAALIDLRHRILPDLMTLPLLALGLAADMLGLTPVGFEDGLLGCAVGALLGGSLAVAASCGGGRVGGGDVKLLMALGAWLGPVGIALALLLAGSAHALGVVVLRMLDGRSPAGSGALPFGPALALGALAVLAGALDHRLLALALPS